MVEGYGTGNETGSESGSMKGAENGSGVYGGKGRGAKTEAVCWTD